MSAKVAYSPPPRELPEAPKNFVILLIGIMLCIVGALLINQGIDVAKSVGLPLVLSMGLLAAGAMLILVGASHAWPRSHAADIVFFIVGILCIVGSGVLLAENLRDAAYATALTLIGIMLIIAGVKVAGQAWKRARGVRRL